MAKSWHKSILKSRKPAKSSANRIRFETVLLPSLQPLHIAYFIFLGNSTIYFYVAESEVPY
jgi:hypothetical protein